MKKKNSLLIASCCLLGLASCMQDVEVREKPITEVTDLKVPADFSWSMSRDVLLTIDSSVETMVEVFSTKNCEEGSLLAKINVPAEDIPLSVPNSVQELYVRYTKKDGSKAVLTIAGVTTRSAESKKAMLPEDAGAIIDTDEGAYLAYPAVGYGTLMFEDSWPLKGDYDLNDFVAHYKIQTYLEGGKNKKVSSFIVNVQLMALGGALPYQLYMQVDQAKTNNIDDIENYSPKGAIGKFEQVETKNNEPLLIAFDWGKLKGVNGGSYYNTEEGYLITGSLDANQIILFVELDNPVPLSTWSHASFDFFLKRENASTEIHMKGYRPTEEFMKGYIGAIGKITDSPYSTDDNFVWGVKVPTAIKHPMERVSIMKTYPTFGAWVSSGGVTNQDWYKRN